MNRNLISIGIVAACALLFPNVGSAANYNVQFCFQWDGAYSDAAGGDYWTSGGPQTARGVFVRVTRNWDGYQPFADYTDPDTGCTPTLTMSSIFTFTITMLSYVKVYNNNVVYLQNDPDNRVPYSQVVVSNFRPSYSGQVPPYVWEDVLNDHVPQAIGAAGYALNKRYAGMSNQAFFIYRDDPSPPCSPACTHDQGDIWIGTGGDDKFRVTHEMGHAVIIRRDENLRRDPDYDAPNSDCPEYSAGGYHDFASREYINDAVSEGSAHFYAATVWNNPYESDCKFYYYKTVNFDPWDFDIYGDPIPDPNPNYDCQADRKFMLDHCYPWRGYGIESDWLSFWWDLHSLDDWTFGRISDIYDCADQHLWTSSTDVYDILRECAYDYVGSYTDWDNRAEDAGVIP